MKKRFLSQIVCTALLICLLSSCAPKITNVRTNNIVSYYKKGMHINTVDSLGSLSRVESFERKNRITNYDSKNRHELNVNFENKSYKIIVVGIVNEVREVDRTEEKSGFVTKGDAGYDEGRGSRNPNTPQYATTYKNVKINIEIEDDLFLIFKDDKLENWLYLYELLNSPKEKDRKLGDLIANEYVKFKNPKREE